MQHSFSCTDNDNKQRERLWTELLPGRLAQMLQYFPFFIRFGAAFSLLKKKRKKGAEGRKYVLAQHSGLQQEFSRTLKCTEKPGGSLEPLLIAFNRMQTLSFYWNGSAAFLPHLFRLTGVKAAQLLYQVKHLQQQLSHCEKGRQRPW